MEDEEAALKVFLCDDTEPFRALMRMALPDAGLHIVGEAGDGCACVSGVLRSGADAILLDLAMPGCDGMTAICSLREEAPGCAIVAFSGFNADKMAARCFALGAHAYLEKGTELDEVRATLREAVATARCA